jgi:hypothetical protein
MGGFGASTPRLYTRSWPAREGGAPGRPRPRTGCRC